MISISHRLFSRMRVTHRANGSLIKSKGDFLKDFAVEFQISSCGHAILQEALSVCQSVGPSVMIELESVKTRITAPAHPSATGVGHVSGLVIWQF